MIHPLGLHLGKPGATKIATGSVHNCLRAGYVPLSSDTSFARIRKTTIQERHQEASPLLIRQFGILERWPNLCPTFHCLFRHDAATNQANISGIAESTPFPFAICSLDPHSETAVEKTSRPEGPRSSAVFKLRVGPEQCGVVREAAKRVTST